MFEIISKSLIFEAAKGAIDELFEILPLLFIIFILVELIEYFYLDKLKKFALKAKNVAPVILSALAIFPQCGFSIVGAILYIKGYITKGALLAVFISTSDEAIPVLLAEPSQFGTVSSLLLIKFSVGVIFGYLIDYLLPTKKFTPKALDFEEEKGCCEHDLEGKNKIELVVHPIVHTFNISIFIFLITFILNVALLKFGGAQALGERLLGNSALQCIFASIFGLIPNCAISVAFALLYIKGAISFASTLSGLCASGGLGIWVLIRKNKKKDSLLIIGLLFLISAGVGIFAFLISKLF